MAELEGYGEFDGGGGSDDDDIARFERQCAERARAEGMPSDEEGAASDEEPDEQIKKVRLVTGAGPGPQDSSEWRQKCELLQEKLSRRENELALVRDDLDMLRSEGIGPNDPQTELKQRLLDLTKKNRRMQVTVESQKSRLRELEAEVKKPKEEAKRQVEELVMQNAAALMGDNNVEDWKKKYLTASNQLQQVRHEVQELRNSAQKHKKVLLKELGSEESIDKALAVADDPNSKEWKGRAAQIAQLQRQLKELKEKAMNVAQDAPAATLAPAQAAAAATAATAAANNKAVEMAANKRREEFERLQEETEKLKAEAAEGKRKRDALKSRTSHLEAQLKELKANVQFLLRKSDDDDALVAVLRRQLGRHGEQAGETQMEDEGELEALREENSELQSQLERQAQIVLQLRQKSLSASATNGSVPLGPKSAEAGISERQLVERVRFLEAENTKQSEQVRLLKDQLGEGARPFSGQSNADVKDKLRQMTERLAYAERENQVLRQGSGSPDLPDASPRSRPSSRGSSRGPGPDSEQVLRQNEALKREIVRLRNQMSSRGNA